MCGKRRSFSENELLNFRENSRKVAEKFGLEMFTGCFVSLGVGVGVSRALLFSKKSCTSSVSVLFALLSGLRGRTNDAHTLRERMCVCVCVKLRLIAARLRAAGSDAVRHRVATHLRAESIHTTTSYCGFFGCCFDIFHYSSNADAASHCCVSVNCLFAALCCNNAGNDGKTSCFVMCFFISSAAFQVALFYLSVGVYFLRFLFFAMKT